MADISQALDVCGTQNFGLGVPVRGNVSSFGGLSKYRTLEARIRSFEERGWPISMPQRPAELAEAGFYYTGTGDFVLCFACDGGLKKWRPDDDPWTEHARWFDECEYLLDRKSPEFIRSAKASDRDDDEPPSTELAPRSIEPPFLDVAVSVAESGGQGDDARERESKLATWPRDRDDDEDMRPTSTDDLLADYERLKEERSCRVCLDGDRTVVFLPCRHLATCPSCAAVVKTCPVCRSGIERVVKIYSA